MTIFRKKLRESPDLCIGNSLCRITWVGKPDEAASAPSAAAVESSSGSDGAASGTGGIGMNSSAGMNNSQSAYGALHVDRRHPFGYKYIFHLEDAIDDCAEFLIDFPRFTRSAPTQPNI